MKNTYEGRNGTEEVSKEGKEGGWKEGRERKGGTNEGRKDVRISV